MADAHHMESDEIDLEGVDDDTTLFSDKEKIPIEHVNFEFEQASKLHGLNAPGYDGGSAWRVLLPTIGDSIEAG